MRSVYLFVSLVIRIRCLFLLAYSYPLSLKCPSCFHALFQAMLIAVACVVAVLLIYVYLFAVCRLSSTRVLGVGVIRAWQQFDREGVVCVARLRTLKRREIMSNIRHYLEIMSIGLTAVEFSHIYACNWMCCGSLHLSWRHF